MKTEFEFVADTEAATDLLGQRLAAALPPAAVVALSGTLGAGKTRLVQAVATALGVAADVVTSPTFVLCQQYDGTRRIYHLDTYRLKDADEFLELGVEEYFDADALTFIEWAERVEDCLPAERLSITIHIEDDDRRRFVVQSHGSQYHSTIARLAAAE